MRSYVDREKLDDFMTQLGRRATSSGTVFTTGGSTALLLGIRNQTIDTDIRLNPEPEGAFAAITELNVSADEFVPPLTSLRKRFRQRPIQPVSP